jgi:hypothetical protein
MLFFKPQTFLRPLLVPSQLNIMTHMQTRTFVKSMEERKEDSDKKAF